MSGDSSGRVGVDLIVFFFSALPCVAEPRRCYLLSPLLYHLLWKVRLPPISPGCRADLGLSDWVLFLLRVAM